MNGLYALTIILIVYAIGDFVATKSKAVISMLFVASILFAIGFWNGLPASIFQDSTLQLFASVTVGLMLVHMGTTIKLKELIAEWKTVVLVLCSTIGICLGVYFIGQLIIDRYEALIAAPIVGGGVVAFLVMSDALKAAGSNIVLFGFPGTFIVPSEVSKAVGETEEERQLIQQHIMPRMLIAGMVSVSIVSVLFAGVMVNWI